MTTGTSIANQVIKILGYVNNTIRPEGVEGQDNVLKALYNMHKLSPTYAVITCPVQHGNFFYISENCKAVFGYEAQYMADHFRHLPHYFSQVHSADMNDLQDCMKNFETVMGNESPQDYHKLRTVLHYRFRTADGNYVYLQDEKATLITEDAAIVHYSLIRTMPAEAIFSGVKMEVYKDESQVTKIMEYKPSASKNKLTNRENDLVRLIKQGLTTKEIAWQLSISHNTVRNIKSKLFEKFSVNNTVELLNMTS